MCVYMCFVHMYHVDMPPAWVGWVAVHVVGERGWRLLCLANRDGIGVAMVLASLLGGGMAAGGKEELCYEEVSSSGNNSGTRRGSPRHQGRPLLHAGPFLACLFVFFSLDLYQLPLSYLPAFVYNQDVHNVRIKTLEQWQRQVSHYPSLPRLQLQIFLQ